MSDRTFEDQMCQAKKAHERFTTAIIQCDVFPNLDKVNPLSYPEEDEIPPRFSPKHYLHKPGSGAVAAGSKPLASLAGSSHAEPVMISTDGSGAQPRRKGGAISFELL
mmetsp:Transcript_21674/g.26661  ORF Transcript_21674/g.26661 Transcript_21674/m.26661 type:complete len:108 (+) Transcript_21674:860-1183(+)